MWRAKNNLRELIQINVDLGFVRHFVPREADELVSSRSSLGLLPKLGGASAPPFFSIRHGAG
jgi:hypothetical protein